MKEKRFKVGDKVTYKSNFVFTHGYCHGGDDLGGYVGEILEYKSFNDNRKSWEIEVTTNCGVDYCMLESEFEEYDKPKTVDLFPIY